MLKKVLPVLFFMGFFSSLGWSQIQPVDFSQMLKEAGELAQKGEWDHSELVFLKAAESPIPDYRIQAYEGLQKLYTTLRMPKKAKKAEGKLEHEKKFLEKLVPENEKFYKEYTIQEGDTYAKIAAREQISLEWLKRANQRKLLKVGKTVRIPLMHDSIVVHKNDKILEWWRDKELIKKYPISVGRKGSETPQGEFKIVSKVKHPIWYRLKLQIPPDSPENLLGTRWLGLDVKSYGIHGTRNPKSISQAMSHGCVRMFNRDVEELFDWIPLGTTVRIE